jgi:CRP-like cAMP-binding protein
MTTMPDATSFLASLDGLPVRSFAPGELVLSAGTTTGQVLVLKEGTLEVVKDGVPLTRVSEPGAVFGEMAALLRQPHSADVRALEPTDLYLIEDASFFMSEPAATLHVAMILARRLDAVNGYLVQARGGLVHAGHSTGLIDRIIADIGRAIRYGPMLP